MIFKQTFAAALFGLLLAAFSPAQAAIQTYNFSGAIDSGSLLGQSYSGNFSFDDAALTDVGTEWLSVGSLAMIFMGNAYTQADVAAGADVEVGYQDGAFLGLSYSVDTAAHPFSFVPGTSNVSDAFFAYDNGAGYVNYALAPVPEAETYAMMLAGLGLVGFAAARRRQA